MQAMKYLLVFAAVGLAQAKNDTTLHGWMPEPDGRGTWSILWSSLVTVSLCTWSVLHLNVRSGQHSWWGRPLRKIKWMLITLLAPEIILVLGAFNFLGAREVLTEITQSGGSGWTIVHVRFALANGFKIVENDGEEEDCSGKDLIKLVKDGILCQPPISENELNCRSQSDGFVKAIAVLQIFWFAVQTLTRAVQHLHVTALEIMVIAFIFCSILTYIFTWNKPQNVEYPVMIALSSKKSESKTRAHSGEPTMTSENTAAPDNQIRHQVEQINPETMIPPELHVTPSDMSRSAENQISSKKPSLHELLMVRFWFKNGVIIIVLLTSLFGAIHCLAWNLPFPSYAELLLWRSCAVITSSIPMLIALLAGPFYRFDHLSVPILLVALYTLARIILILQAFISLRQQPADAYQTTNWTQYLPNVAA